MKATDLKIGDWVEYFGPVQIAELNMFLWSGWAEDHHFITNIDYKDTKPILINNEILKKNSFIEYETDRYEYKLFRLYYNRELNLYEIFYLGPSSFLGTIKYIHELQHFFWVFKVEDSIKNLECTDIIFED